MGTIASILVWMIQVFVIAVVGYAVIKQAVKDGIKESKEK